jgi:uncharacterized protein (DUF1330 family)
MTVYAVALLKITDREAYGAYERGFMDAFTPYGGRMLAADDAITVVEGDWPYSRTVLIEFPDAATFDAWYHSPAYQVLVKLRTAASVAAISRVRALPNRAPVD